MQVFDSDGAISIDQLLNRLWIAGRFAGLDPAKESFIRVVRPFWNVLQNLQMHGGKCRALLFPLRQ
jgi:hypothetical protein